MRNRQNCNHYVCVRVCLPILFHLYFLSVCSRTFFFFFLWLHWVFVSVRGLSLVAAGGGHSSSRCAGLSPSWPLLLWSTGSRRAGSVVVAHGPSCSAACGIFPHQGSNPCPLHWQADSQPLRHQGSPVLHFYHLVTTRMLCKWNQTVHKLLGLAFFFIQHNSLDSSCLVYQWFIPFYC